jgi:hypothetical protein
LNSIGRAGFGAGSAKLADLTIPNADIVYEADRVVGADCDVIFAEDAAVFKKN